MAAESSWSLRGVDPRAREAARTAARREGVSIGEWMNRRLLEEERQRAHDRDDMAARTTFDEDDFDADEIGAVVDRLAQRIEVAERRSTLAVSGIDQSVVGVISRLQATELAQTQIAGRVEDLSANVEDLERTIVGRLDRLEADETPARTMSAVKAVEAALTQLAADSSDADASLRRRLDGVETAVETVGSEVQRANGDLAKRMDTLADHTTLQVRRLKEDLQRDVETRTAAIEQRVSTQLHADETSLAKLVSAVDRINSRLDGAETVTSNAIRALEASFASIDDRLRSTEARIDDGAAGLGSADTDAALQDARSARLEAETARRTADAALEAARRATAGGAMGEDLERRLEDKLETLGRRVGTMVAESRAEFARQIEEALAATAGQRLDVRLGELQTRVADAEERHAETLERIAEQVARMASVVEKRLKDNERRTEAVAQHAAAAALQGAAGVDRVVETRLRDMESTHANALTRMSDEVSRIVERVQDRLAATERRSTEALEDVGAQVARINEKLNSRQGELSEDVARRLKAVEDRATRTVEDALQTVFRKIDEGQDQAAAALSPLQRALTTLTARLEALEDQTASPFGAAPYPVAPPPFDPAAEYQDQGRAVGGARSTDLPFVEPASAGPAPATSAADADLYADVDFADTLFDESGPYAHTASGHATTFHDTPGHDRQGPNAAARAETPRSVDPIAAARQAMREQSGSSLGRSEASTNAGFGLAAAPSARRKPDRKVLVAASGAALVAVGAAAYMIWPSAEPRATGPVDPFDGLVGDTASANLAGAPRGLGLEAAATAPISPAIGAEPEMAFATPAETLTTPAEKLPASTGLETRRIETAELPPPPVESPRADLGAQNEAPTVVAAPPAPIDAPVPALAVEPPPRAAEPPAAPTAQPSPIEQAAATGDPIAQFQLGENRLQSGDAVDGVRLVRLAAENGLAPAQYRLGKLFETGENVAKDLAEARRWMERAAEGGHRRAMHTLAIFYAEGRGATQDFAAAARWFEQASLYGATDSQYNLAVLYEQGLGVPLSLADAYAWYAIAGRAGDADAKGRADALSTRLSAEAKAGADQAIAAFQPEPVDQAANGVFRDLPWDRPQLSGEAAILRAQTLLAAVGYEVGAPDGRIGPRTRTAIIEYQREAGLRQTGAVDATLLERLEADTAR